jgi:hypothetical protein
MDSLFFRRLPHGNVSIEMISKLIGFQLLLGSIMRLEPHFALAGSKYSNAIFL